MNKLCIVIGFLLTALSSHAYDEPVERVIDVRNLVIKHPLPGKWRTVAYLEISNEGKVSDKLVSVEADWAEIVEVHTHEIRDGVMSMYEIAELEIPSNDRIVFESGGYHLMIYKLFKERPDNPMMKFCFENSGCIHVKGLWEYF